MIVERAPEVVQLRDHWWWREGWQPGSRHLQWYLTFEGQDALHDSVTDLQKAVAGFAGLASVPLPWLHLTLAGFGEARSMTDEDVCRLITATHERLSGLPDLALVFARVLVLAESVVLVPERDERLADVQRAITEAARQVLGEQGDRLSVPFSPHLSVAYAGGSEDAEQVLASLQQVAPAPSVTARPTLSLVEVQRDDQAYTWRLVSAFPL